MHRHLPLFISTSSWLEAHLLLADTWISPGRAEETPSLRWAEGSWRPWSRGWSTWCLWTCRGTSCWTTAPSHTLRRPWGVLGESHSPESWHAESAFTGWHHSVLVVFNQNLGLLWCSAFQIIYPFLKIELNIDLWKLLVTPSYSLLMLASIQLSFSTDLLLFISLLIYLLFPWF